MNTLPNDVLALIISRIPRGRHRTAFLATNSRACNVALTKVWCPWIVEKEYPRLIPNRFHKRTIGFVGSSVVGDRGIGCGLIYAICGNYISYYQKWRAYAGKRWNPRWENGLIVHLLFHLERVDLIDSILGEKKLQKLIPKKITMPYIMTDCSEDFLRKLVSNRVFQKVMNQNSSTLFSPRHHFLFYLLKRRTEDYVNIFLDQFPNEIEDCHNLLLLLGNCETGETRETRETGRRCIFDILKFESNKMQRHDHKHFLRIIVQHNMWDEAMAYAEKWVSDMNLIHLLTARDKKQIEDWTREYN